jgi:hypothetical protein
MARYKGYSGILAHGHSSGRSAPHLRYLRYLLASFFLLTSKQTPWI